MKYILFWLGTIGILVFASCSTELPATGDARVQKQLEAGIIEGVYDREKGVERYLGIPYAKPPVGAMRWRRPEAVAPWEGVREAREFGNTAMQYKFASWVQFDEEKLSEDCLYLNVWAPAQAAGKKLPVVVKFHGGGLIVGSAGGHDLSYTAAKGVVVVAPNYRLNVFGFFAHPELSAEDPHGSSGNYGFWDQLFALRWVKENIAAFGGDPDRITVEGESAGAISVNAHMASPLSKDLFVGAIASSGGLVRPLPTLEAAEAFGKQTAEAAGYPSLAALRAASAEEILEFYKRAAPEAYWPIVDGQFLPANPTEIFTANAQAQIPLMIGWNSAELDPHAFMQGDAFTPENFVRRTEARYGEQADSILTLFPHESEAEIRRSAVDLASLDFENYNTWKWFDLHRKHCERDVYRFLFSRAVPPAKNTDTTRYRPPLGARHAQDIPYAWGTIVADSVTNYREADYRLSALMQAYYFNFMQGGNPNGDDLPEWPAVESDRESPAIMNFDLHPETMNAEEDYRYRFFDNIYQRETHWLK